MKVGVVHNLRAGGAHRRLSEQLGGLDADVVEVCLSTALPITTDAVVIGYRPLAPALPPSARPPLRYVDLAQLVAAWRRAARALAVAAPDVVMANPCRFLQAPTALLWTCAPTLYFCDEPREPIAELAASRNPGTRRLYRPLHAAESRLDGAAVARATRLATNSSYTVGEIRRIYGRSATVLPMGVPDRFTPSFEPPGSILSVGTLIPGKGHEITIRAAGLASERRPVLVVAPRAGPAEHARLTQIAATCGVELRVRVAITDDQLVAAYRGAFATLYMAVDEPFGLASLEAQACGSPVVVTASGGLPQTLVDGATGWAVPRDPAAVAAKLDLLEDPDRRIEMARAAAARAGRMRWASAARALEQILRALADTRVARSTR
jgi:glycosyltransferase involved in cell wall biosynthesis